MSASRRAGGGVRGLALVLVLTTSAVCGLQAPAKAMLAPAAVPGESPSYDRAADVASIQKALESKMLRQRLRELGLGESEIESRLQRLDDRQVHELATRIRSLEPGGDTTLVGALVVVALVLLIIYLLNRV